MFSSSFNFISNSFFRFNGTSFSEIRIRLLRCYCYKLAFSLSKQRNLFNNFSFTSQLFPCFSLELLFGKSAQIKFGRQTNQRTGRNKKNEQFWYALVAWGIISFFFFSFFTLEKAFSVILVWRIKPYKHLLMVFNCFVLKSFSENSLKWFSRLKFN